MVGSAEIAWNRSSDRGSSEPVRLPMSQCAGK